MPDFLFEIGLEEIPARMIAPAQAELVRRVEELLARENLLESAHEIHGYSTPRRLAVLVKGVSAKQADREEQLVGPPWAAAFKNGEATAAARAFAKKAGVDLTTLAKVSMPKGEYAATTAHRKGRTAAEILTDLLPKELAALYWPKNMYWRTGKPERFVRPVKWLLALLDRDVVPVEFAGVHAANLTYGHRVLYGNEALAVGCADDYLGVLESAKVTADVELRRHRIRKGLDAAMRSVPGARWREDEALVDTVTHMTEWPTALLGSFDAEHLKLPEEVLVTVMRNHQKYFAVEDAQGKLAPYFLTVLNTQPEVRAEGIIRHGNERVLRARFNDARFFWEFDQKIPLTDRVEMLKSVTFQKDLGSYWDKTEAVCVLVAKLSAVVGNRIDFPSNHVNDVFAAARLAKTDLTTELVKEFTELQGVVGGLYARAQGLGESVAQAIYWQYSPAGMGDAIPPTVEGQILGIADRFQTVSAMFSLGLEPTGSKDPFGLRRAGNGIVKIFAESKLPLKFADLDDYADMLEPRLRPSLHRFFRERVEFYLREIRSFSYDVVNAVLAVGFDDVRDAIARADALSALRGSSDFEAVAAAFKRIKNILRQASEKGQFAWEMMPVTKKELLSDPAEVELHQYVKTISSSVANALANHNYRLALGIIATIRPHIDLFFEGVMVLAEDPDLRKNRLSLIAEIDRDFSSIADFSEIVTN